MAIFRNRETSVAFDIAGCPNRCRHCWLGCANNKRLKVEDTLEVFENIKSQVSKSNEINLKNIKYYATWLREPDFLPEYKKLYELELELNDHKSYRNNFELLSIWRLAHDKEYVKWAKEIGTQKCQVTLFGGKDTTDWFYRRKKAYEDVIKATDALIEHGIIPRWQLFFTKKILNEFDIILDKIKELKIVERLSSQGKKFELFIHPPGPIGEGFKIEHLRVEKNNEECIPDLIIEKTREHYSKDKLWYAEEELIKEFVREDNIDVINMFIPNVSWLFIDSNWNVYSNLECTSFDPWWKLGNIKRNSIKEIIKIYEDNKCYGLKVASEITAKELVEKYGNTYGQKLYESKGDLLSYYLNRFCKENYSKKE